MNITIADFRRFFAAVNSGCDPFPWQQRLTEMIYSEGRWPDAITAPTGAGKSAVVDVHIFLSALSAVGSGPRLPRRLCVVVDRRALVDSQADRAKRIVAWLDHSGDPLAQVMKTALLGIRSGSDLSPVVLTNLRGGIASDTRWIDDPGACAVISATPDMWGSRLLMRGYGTSRGARPREAGLLGIDSVAVVDEAHLTRQLLGTARWIAAQNEQPASRLGIPGLQVVESSATARLDGDQKSIGITEADLTDPGLASRMMKPKPIELVTSADWSGKRANSKHIAVIVSAARQLRTEAEDGTIGCVVNNVRTAVEVAKALDPDCPCWVGPMRPMDLDDLKAGIPALFGDAEDSSRPSPPFLVATQTVEVGIDIDFAGLVTELAPADSLAQRFGRVNRRGLRASGPIRVVTPGPQYITDQLPYLADDLKAGMNWLSHFVDGEGASPRQIMACSPPARSPERSIIKLPHPGDVMRWEVTHDELFAEEELELWTRDSLEPEQVLASLVLRDELPEDDAESLPLLAATPPVDDEMFPADLRVLRLVVSRILGEKGPHARAFIYRDREFNAVHLDGDRPLDLRPGDVVVIDNDHPVTSRGVVVPDASENEHPKAGWGAAGTKVILPGSPDAHLLTALCGISDEEAQEAFDDDGGEGILVRGPDLSEGIGLPWIVVKPQVVVSDDETIRQVWTTSSYPVTLEAHQVEVAGRAESLASRIGLGPDVTELLREAGLHHDDGKEDSRFQRIRLGSPEGMVLAKSWSGSAQEAARRQWRGGLPRGWRHELRSVAVAWPDITKSSDPELAARLIGTTHGHGRVLPQQSASSLINPSDDAAIRERILDLFVSGEWCALMERTSRRVGPWACCYLEAVLRAADCQISKEGS
jgi:CRISPR-associated endonuclease/helicase Cas3